MKLNEKYIVEHEKYRPPDLPSDYGDHLKCSVFEVADDGSKKKLGEYVRNYGTFYDTWEPFEKDGKHYALCSPQYGKVSVMSLPSCEIIAEEKGGGFCPTGFYVPTEIEWHDCKSKEPDLIPNDFSGHFGFVCGCAWGDDHSWKVRFIRLDKIEQGIVNVDSRFGYFELPSRKSLRDSVFVTYAEKEDGEDNLEIQVVGVLNWFGELDGNN